MKFPREKIRNIAIVAHNDLPTFARLREEGQQILDPDFALHQDIRELHIGHAIVSRAVFVGLREAVREMKALMRAAASMPEQVATRA